MPVSVTLGMVVVFFVYSVAHTESLEQEHHCETGEHSRAEDHRIIGEHRALSTMLSREVKPFGDHHQEGRREKQAGGNTGGVMETLVGETARDQSWGEPSDDRQDKDDYGQPDD